LLIPAAPDAEVEDGYGYHLLEHLSRKGWSAVVTANGLGGVIVECDRDGNTIRVSGPSVESCAPRIFHEAFGFRAFAS
jgi:hypothetical protein